MLTCKEFLSELGDFLDKSCASDLRAKLEAHLTQCPNCFVVADTTKKTVEVYKGMTAQELPPEIKCRLNKALEAKMRSKGCKG